MTAKEGKYLTFSLGKETYGIPIVSVKEIIGIISITEVPKTPKFIKGVINLRGNIIPLLDLRLKFNMNFKEYDDRTCIVVIELTHNDTKKWIGIAVESVSEVIYLNQENIEPPHEYFNDENQNFLIGMGKLKEQVILLLDIENILSSKEKNIITEIGGEENV